MKPEAMDALVAALEAETDALIGALEAESAALTARDMAALEDRARAKTDAAAAWESRLTALAAAAGGLQALPPEVGSTVEDMASRLTRPAAENTRLLQIAVEAGRRTMAAIADAAQALAPSPGVYGQDGGRVGRPGRASAAGVAVSFDRTL